MLLSDIKRKHNFRGRTETKISFQGENSQQGKHESGPQDQRIKAKEHQVIILELSALFKNEKVNYKAKGSVSCSETLY